MSIRITPILTIIRRSTNTRCSLCVKSQHTIVTHNRTCFNIAKEREWEINLDCISVEHIIVSNFKFLHRTIVGIIVCG